jgi:hypothetical protein
MDALQVHLEVVGLADTDRAELAELTSDLGGQLRQLDAEVTRPGASAAGPEGTKGIDLGQLSELVVTVAQAPVLVAVVECIKRWVRHPGASKVRIRVGDDEIEMDGDPSDQQRELIAAFLERHGR